jgi:hypothetical protein
MKHFPIFREIMIDDFISVDHAARFGLVFLSDVSFERENTKFLPEDGRVAFSLYLEKLPVGGIDILIKIEEETITDRLSGIYVGDKLILRDQLIFNNDFIVIPFDNLRAEETGSSSVNIVFLVSGTVPIRFTSLQIGELPAIDKKASHSISGQNLKPYLVSGWSISTENGTWTNSSASQLMLRFAEGNSNINFTLSGRLMKNGNGLQTMNLFTNGSLIKTVKLDQNSLELISIPLKNVKLDENFNLFLDIHISDPCSPSSISGALDDRILGFELHAIVFQKSNLVSRILKHFI